MHATIDDMSALDDAAARFVRAATGHQPDQVAEALNAAAEHLEHNKPQNTSANSMSFRPGSLNPTELLMVWRRAVPR